MTDDVWSKPRPVPVDPCNRQCGVSSVTGYCRGCFRKLDEIVKWDRMDEDEQLEVLEKCEQRKQKAI